MLKIYYSTIKFKLKAFLREILLFRYYQISIILERFVRLFIFFMPFSLILFYLLLIFILLALFSPPIYFDCMGIPISMPVDLHPVQGGLPLDPRTDYAFLNISDSEEEHYLIVDPNYITKNVVFKYYSEDHGLRKFFKLNPDLIDRPEVLAEAYKVESNLGGLIYRLFSTEAIFICGGEVGTLDLFKCVDEIYEIFKRKYNIDIIESKSRAEWQTICLNELGSSLHGKSLLFSEATPLPLLLGLDEQEFMLEARKMHIEAIKIYLADSHPLSSRTEYRGHANFIGNLDKTHWSYSLLLDKYSYSPRSVLDLARGHYFLRDLWDLEYTELSIFSESKWIFDEPTIPSNSNIPDIYFPIDIQPSCSNLQSVGLGIVDDFIRSKSPVFYISSEEPEDIFATSIDIFKEEEQTAESLEVGPEDYLEDGLWIFEEEE